MNFPAIWLESALGELLRKCELPRLDLVSGEPVGGVRLDVVFWLSTGFPGFAGFDLGNLDPAWQVTGVGDYNVDGAADIVLRHDSSGDVYLFLTGPGGVWEGAALGARSLDWSIEGLGDYDGDGRSDILWRQASTGMASLWRFTSATTFETLDIAPVGAEWTVVNP